MPRFSKMSRVMSSGRCELGGKSCRKSGMGRQLKSCLAKAAGADGRSGETGRSKSIHLMVEDAYCPEYWLHLAPPDGVTLPELDKHRREIWLECCGHLSLFSIVGTEHCSPAGEVDTLGRDEHNGMPFPMERVAPPDTRFCYEYDFGSTTELALRSVSELNGRTDPIRLLARNDPPVIDCARCGETAAWVCPDDSDWIAMTTGLCDACVSSAAYRLPIVNSPRCGVCCCYDGEPVRIVDNAGG